MSEYREILDELEGARLEPSLGRWIPGRPTLARRILAGLRRMIAAGRR